MNVEVSQGSSTTQRLQQVLLLTDAEARGLVGIRQSASGFSGSDIRPYATSVVATATGPARTAQCGHQWQVLVKL